MIRHFKTTAAFRAWLNKNHATATELWLGFFKKHSGRGGLTYKDAVEQALCFGWIDGVVKRVDDATYVQRFSPRRSRSKWSTINRRRAIALRERGLMTPAGLEAFEAHDGKGAPYSYE